CHRGAGDEAAADGGTHRRARRGNQGPGQEEAREEEGRRPGRRARGQRLVRAPAGRSHRSHGATQEEPAGERPFAFLELRTATPFEVLVVIVLEGRHAPPSPSGVNPDGAPPTRRRNAAA